MADPGSATGSRHRWWSPGRASSAPWPTSTSISRAPARASQAAATYRGAARPGTDPFSPISASVVSRADTHVDAPVRRSPYR